MACNLAGMFCCSIGISIIIKNKKIGSRNMLHSEDLFRTFLAHDQNHWVRFLQQILFISVKNLIKPVGLG